ncbi:TetR/AcrR family transcriptional regulator [Streptomyces hokutonensis]|uniref:TetR/AcrR family transcriptional regulator n=1 Tax=Streptomyces hokutonensis TaxID=1306990 RepID=UPI0037FB6D3A
MPKVSPEYLDARRAQIIEVARELFSQQGVSDTSMSDLVAASGMSMGSIYRYFASKDELIAAVVEGRDGTVEGEYPTAESPGDILARLLSHVSGPNGAAHARLSAQIWGSAAVQPALAEIARARHTVLRDHLAARIRDTRRPDATADDRSHTELAEVMLAALVGYANLAAAGYDVIPSVFQQTLEGLLDRQES